ncbi:glycosyltransferase [Mesoflavibacter sp. SCSIO 43206]|uniref:glycosyltransferase family 2 protein n=1 Tax=Mesoflavibacter sp. SCSIO 43206 TaxID=2779362 RepID=UPI001CA9447D|nr:glycosyltransferase [Mesoflavibacter sp. SCSIO 43206]UAB74708.1 glycosyltransferase [Mesoflavibacter sp. SCSIO 43206]
MITYNHQDYIVEALEGVFKQQSDFVIELILSNDCSTDQTHQKITNFLENNTSSNIQIKYFNHTENLGMMPNFKFALEQCKGKYIALCEGDDYWTDQHKLQKQLDFLEMNIKYSLCFHNVYKLNQRNGANESNVMLDYETNQVFTTEDLISQWFVPTASILFRNYSDFIFPDWFYNCGSGDIPLLLLLSLRGDLYYLNETMGVYRLQDNGVSVAHKGYWKVFSMIYLYKSFDIHTNYKFSSKIYEAMIYELQKHTPDLKEIKALQLENKKLKKALEKNNKYSVRSLFNYSKKTIKKIIK